MHFACLHFFSSSKYAWASMDFNNNGRNHLFLIKLFQRNGLMKYFEIDLCIHSHNWIWPQLNGIYRRWTERYIIFFGSLSIKGYKFKMFHLAITIAFVWIITFQQLFPNRTPIESTLFVHFSLAPHCIWL